MKILNQPTMFYDTLISSNALTMTTVKLIYIDTRALFERALAAIPSDRSKSIWSRYIDYETQYGDISNLYRIEQRMGEVFPPGYSLLILDDINSIEHAEKLASKWRYFDIDVVGKFELGLEALSKVPRQPAPAAQSKINGPSGHSDKREDRGRQLAMLRGVDVDKFPHPDTSRWVSYKAEPGTARTMPVNTISTQSRKPSVDRPAIAGSTAPLVPEPIARFAGMLPRKELYNGKLY
jgi:cleavage stimulation factor subunit 3